MRNSFQRIQTPRRHSRSAAASSQNTHLDEPTEGLDPNQKFSIRSFIKQYGERNIVIISTHIMEEVEAMANRVILLHRGKLIRDTTPQELKKLRRTMI